MRITKDSKGRCLNPNEDQMADGRYRYRYYDSQGGRHAIYAWKLVKSDKAPAGKKDGLSLREQIKQLNRDKEDGIKFNDQSKTVYQLIIHYLDTKAKLADTTKNNYLYLVEQDIRHDKFGRMCIGDVKKSHVKEFYRHLYKERNLSVGTLGLFQNIISPAFELAVDDDIIRKNPAKDCLKEYTSNTKDDGKVIVKFALTKDQQARFLGFIRSSVPYRKYLVMIVFILSTGCRIGEALGLTWNDISFKDKVVSINHQVLYKRRKKGEKIHHYIETPKNGTSREIPLNADILKLLLEYKEKTYFTRKSNFTVDGYRDFVFLNNELRLYTPNTIVRAFHKMVDAYNRMVINNDDIDTEDKMAMIMPDITPHILRHTFCTRCAENKMDVKVLQQYMGHKTLSVTMEIYNHVNQERVVEESAKLEGMISFSDTDDAIETNEITLKQTS